MKKEKSKKQHYNEQTFLFSSCALINGDIYSVTNMDSIPIKVNLKTRKMSCISQGKDKFINSEDILADNDEMYLLEQNGYRMMKFNVETGLYKYYTIFCHRKEWGNYAAYAKFKKKIYIFPKYMDYMVKIDLETGLIKKDPSLYSEVKKLYKKSKDNEGFIYFWYGFQSKKQVWLFQKSKKEVYVYDLEVENWKQYILPLEVNSCVHIVLKNRIFYILSSEGEIYTWNLDNNDMKVLADFQISSDDNAFVRIAVTDNMIFMLPGTEKNIYWLNLKDGSRGMYKDYPTCFEYCSPDIWSKYLGYCEDNNNYYFAMRSSMFILCINKKNSDLKWLEIDPPSDKEYFGAHYKIGDLLYENQWSLQELIDYMDFENIDTRKWENIGRIIWNQIKFF